MPYVFNPFTGSFDDTVPLQNGKVPADFLPSYVDDILEFANVAAFPAIGETGKIYLALDSNVTYRWGGSQYTATSIASLSSIGDVDATGATPGKSLEWDGVKWAPGALARSYSLSETLRESADYTNASFISSFDQDYRDFSVNNATVTLVGTPTLSSAISKWPNGKSLECTTGSYITIPSITLGSNFTVEFWLYLTAAPSSQSQIFKINYSSTSLTVEVKTDRAVVFRMYSGTYGTTTALNTGQWYHVKLNKQTNVIKIELDGVSFGSFTQSNTYSNTVSIGAITGGFALPIYIDDIRICGSVYKAGVPTESFTTLSYVNPVYSINNLDDVDTATVTPTTNQGLTWDGTNWVPSTIVTSNIAGITGATTITNCVQLSQVDYDAIVTPDPNTLYVIV